MHNDLYLDYIFSRGVGSKDIAASSPASYVLYLNSVSKLLNSDITPQILRSEIDISNITRKLKSVADQARIVAAPIGELFITCHWHCDLSCAPDCLMGVFVKLFASGESFPRENRRRRMCHPKW